jgi:uncharacterized SAM-binding protein YcdF (DUF218 family)
MISLARLKGHAVVPAQGALVALLILGTLTLLGVIDALAFARPLAMPVAMLIGAVLARWFLRPMLVALWIGIGIVAIGLWSPIVPALARPFVRNDPVDLGQVDAVFVFSNTVNSHGLVAGEGVDRLLTGIAVRARRPDLPLIVSTVRSTERQRGISSVADQRALIALSPASGPTEWIDSVYSTRDEAMKLSRRAFLARWKRVAAITSPMHTRRACATVEGLGLQVTCIAAPWRPAGWPPRTASDRLRVMQRLTYESLAWVQYRLSGWARWS